MMSKLIIVRGLPGSGKTTEAKALKRQIGWYEMVEAFIIETDHYFVRPDGEYDFNPRMLKQAHEWCRGRTFAELNYGTTIVSNTFTQWWELEPYIKFCKENGHSVEVITLTTQFENIHKVPEETMKKMAARFESHEDIMKKVNEVMG